MLHFRTLISLSFFSFFLNLIASHHAIASPPDSAHTDSIRYWNRSTEREEVEKVYGDGLLRWIYGTRAGKFFNELFFSRSLPSLICGAYQSSTWSKADIAPFVQNFDIKMDQFEDGPFSCFNDFFIRKFKAGTRTFTQVPGEMPAFVEGRYLAYDTTLPDQEFPVKGHNLSVEGLMGDYEKSKPFIGGPVLLARLNPTDYHRFHFPDDGKILDTYTIPGRLNSVSPIALRENKDILSINERQVSIFETKNFGKVAYIEVGALCVGKIVQSHTANPFFSRGEEKGYFLFGGSTVILIGQAGLWKPDSDLLKKTSEGQETLVQLGTKVGS